MKQFMKSLKVLNNILIYLTFIKLLEQDLFFNTDKIATTSGKKPFEVLRHVQDHESKILTVILKEFIIKICMQNIADYILKCSATKKN